MNRPDHGYAAAVSSWENERARARAWAETGTDRESSHDCIHGVSLVDRCEDCGLLDELAEDAEDGGSS